MGFTCLWGWISDLGGVGKLSGRRTLVGIVCGMFKREGLLSHVHFVFSPSVDLSPSVSEFRTPVIFSLVLIFFYFSFHVVLMVRRYW